MSGWPVRKLSTMLRIQNGFAFDSKRFSPDGSMPLVRIRDLKNGLSTETSYEGDFDARYIVRAGDFLIGMDGEFGCYEWRGDDALLNQRVCKLTDFAAGIEPRFLFYGINSYLKEIEEVTTYTTVKHLSSKQIADIEFPLPPLAEQRQIVAVLDEAFAAIATATANAEKNLANARELFDSELDALVETARLTFAGRALADHCRRVTVGHVGPMKDRYQNEGIPFLRSQNVRPFQIELDSVAFIDEAFDAELVKSRLAPGDVAVVRTGYPGTAAVIPTSLPISNCADLVIIRPSADLNPHYVTAFLNSNLGKRMIAGNLVGAAQKHFNVGAAKKVAIPLPPLPEQERFVARVDELRELSDQLAEVYKHKLGKLATLKQAVLTSAFSGQLTVCEPLAA